MTARTTRFVLQCSMSVLVAACGHEGGAPCTRDDECASHFCRADGTCGPATPDASPTGDGSGDASTGACTPDHDGHISAAELPLVAGRNANFRIATNATWNTAGQSNTDGTRTWSLAGTLANDADQAIALAAPTGTWWHADFAMATYAASLAANSDLLGVFQVTADSVLLLGAVSPAGGPTQTKLTYDPPAKILALPFGAGSHWTSTSTVSGTAQGVIVAYSETYDSLVDQVGTMTTPYGAFPVLRVATDLNRTAGVSVLVANRTFAWAAECFGTVATVRSQDFESGAEFSDDAEVRRLIP
jgi:hypothetical protein